MPVLFPAMAGVKQSLREGRKQSTGLNSAFQTALLKIQANYLLISY